MSARFRELPRGLESGWAVPEPVDDSLLDPRPRCGGGLTVDPRTGLPWCDACYLAALGVNFA